MVSAWGMSPSVAESGGEALRLMHQAAANGEPFPLLLADHRMPGMNGLELVQKITVRPGLSATAIMMLTSDDYYGTALRCAEMNVGAYLIKPIKPSELLSALRRLLATKKNVVVATPIAPSALAHAVTDGLKVLVAEDNVINQRLAKRLLEKMGHRVTVAESGLEALEQVQK